MKRNTSRTTRHKRIRAIISGTADRPRLSVFRSNRNITAQLIDDMTGKTLFAVDTLARKAKSAAPAKKEPKKEPRLVRAAKAGEALAKLAAGKKIKSAVFDRGGYQYHGIVKAVADGARKGGLTF
jgi:large subunit ribosomal protein L18